MAAGQPREEKRKDPESSQPLFLVRVTKCRERLQSLRGSLSKIESSTDSFQLTKISFI